MIFPTINDLTKGKYNRYEIALATAKCARLITNEYVRQRTEAESAVTGNKETDRPLNTLIDKEVRDEKAVVIAARRLYEGQYVITHKSVEEQEREERAILESVDEPIRQFSARDDDVIADDTPGIGDMPSDILPDDDAEQADDGDAAFEESMTAEEPDESDTADKN
jgi:DNA-directed RNA polymerase subunit K/omega